jgi:hypothetical protein
MRLPLVAAALGGGSTRRKIQAISFALTTKVRLRVEGSPPCQGVSATLALLF